MIKAPLESQLEKVFKVGAIEFNDREYVEDLRDNKKDIYFRRVAENGIITLSYELRAKRLVFSAKSSIDEVITKKEYSEEVATLGVCEPNPIVFWPILLVTLDNNGKDFKFSDEEFKGNIHRLSYLQNGLDILKGRLSREMSPSQIACEIASFMRNYK